MILRQPMFLERKNPNTATLPYPVYVFPKLDGIRCVIVDGKPKSRTMKDIPNKHIREALSDSNLEGFDGELIVGRPNSDTVYRDTTSIVMSHDKVSDFVYYVFDMWNSEKGFFDRYKHIRKNPVSNVHVEVLVGKVVQDETGLLSYEEQCLNEGYEGIIIRCPYSPYKQGRTTMKELNTFKLKRFIDGEARVIGVQEEMMNNNEAETNELGRTKRSTKKGGMLGKGSMGALLVTDLETGVAFSIGSGYTRAEREEEWNLGDIIKYKSFPIGTKDKPRFPIYTGRRNMEIDG